MRNKVRNSVRDEVRNAVRNGVRNAARNGVGDEVRNNLQNRVRDGVRNGASFSGPKHFSRRFGEGGNMFNCTQLKDAIFPKRRHNAKAPRESPFRSPSRLCGLTFTMREPSQRRKADPQFRRSPIVRRKM